MQLQNIEIYVAEFTSLQLYKYYYKNLSNEISPQKKMLFPFFNHVTCQ